MSSVLTNLSWKFAERISSQAISLLVSIVLARILAPRDYGVIAMVMMFVTLANVIIDSGFNSALIQKKTADIIDFSSVFYFSLVLSLFVYVGLYISAPYISTFYGDGYEILCPVLRVIGIQIIFNSINAIQQAYVVRNMKFRSLFYSTFIGTCISALVGISMAYANFGVWALVAQYLSSSFINLVALYCVTKKLPSLCFSFNRLKTLLNYGSKIFASSLLIQFYFQIRTLIIGKIYSAQDLAYFDRGKQFPCLVGDNITSSLGTVLFPRMSQEQDNPSALTEMTRKSIRMSSFIMCPLMLGLGAVAEPFVRLVLTDKWLPCVPLLQIFCLVYLFQPIHTANMQAIKALGKSGVFLKLEIIKKVIELIALIAVMYISVRAIVINMALLTTLFTLVNAYPNKKLLNYSFKEQMVDILPSIISSSIMAMLIWLLTFLEISDFLLLFLQVILGVIIYYVIAKMRQCSELIYLEQLVLSKIKLKH